MSQAKSHTSSGNEETRSLHGRFDEYDALGNQGVSDRPKVALMPVHREAVYYNMQHKRRGLAVIFNHENFDIHDLDPRTGTKVDGDNLYRALTNLGFQVTICNDFNLKDIMAHVQEVARMDHTDDDCVIIAVLTHGDFGILYAKDAHYKAENLWYHFTADRCPSLAGKPKLFIVQACQGKELDGGITLSSTIENDGVSKTHYKIPIHADFLIAYSTVPGYLSWRNTFRGSWFIQALSEELRHGSVIDILTLLTFVNQKVAFDFESICPDELERHEKKQVPSFTSMLTRLLVFEKKNVLQPYNLT